MYLRLLLLAAVLGTIAHGRTFVPSKDTTPLVTSLLAKGDAGADAKDEAQSKQRRLDLEHSVVVRPPSSVVQDWSLVCRQLCGAGPGGAPCAPHCSDTRAPVEEHFVNGGALPNPSKDSICRELCRLQLGDGACDCGGLALDRKQLSDPTDAEGVCALFCDRKQITQNGCSACRTSNGGGQQDVRPTAKSEAVTVGADDTTTPDWNELCFALCKTGDGGSLCNCDLLPFAP